MIKWKLKPENMYRSQFVLFTYLNRKYGTFKFNYNNKKLHTLNNFSSTISTILYCLE